MLNVRFKVPPCIRFHQMASYVCRYPSHMLDLHIIYCRQIKDIGEWHHIGSTLLQGWEEQLVELWHLNRGRGEEGDE